MKHPGGDIRFLVVPLSLPPASNFRSSKQLTVEVQNREIRFVVPRNSNTFSDWRRTCNMLWVKTHHLLRAKKLEFELSRDQVLHLKTVANLCVSWRHS